MHYWLYTHHRVSVTKCVSAFWWKVGSGIPLYWACQEQLVSIHAPVVPAIHDHLNLLSLNGGAGGGGG